MTAGSHEGLVGRARKVATSMRNDLGKAGGFVCWWPEEGMATSWCAMMPDPGRWRPGTVAVGPKGEVFEAVGGDDDAGARSWERIG